MSTNIDKEVAPRGTMENQGIESTGTEWPLPATGRNESTIMKIYRSKLINEILNANSIDEVKSSINENLLKIKTQDLRDDDLDRYISYIIEELNDLHGSTLANEYYINLVAADTCLRQLPVLT